MDKNYIIKVKRELTNIKKYATEEELGQLDFNTLDPYIFYGCIYGQMAKNCYSERAKELISLCCNTKTSFSNVAGEDCRLINDKPRLKNGHSTGHTYVEHFIIHHKEYNEHIIDFLKGETDKLIIKAIV